MSSKHFNPLRRAGWGNRLAKTIKIAFLTACLTGLITMPAFGYKFWTGANSANWSDPNNWSPVGAPQSTDELVFGTYNMSDSHHSMVNDIPGLAVSELYFFQNDYQIDGNALIIYSGIYNDLDNGGGGSDSHTTTINCPIIFPYGGQIDSGMEAGSITENTADIYFNGPIEVDANELDIFAFCDPASGGLNGGSNAHIYLSGVMSGAGDLSASATEVSGHVSSVVFDGTPGNTFTGTLYLSTLGNCQITFNKSSGAVATNCVAVIDGNMANLQLSGPNQIGNNATLLITDGSTLSLSGNNVTVGTLVFTNVSADADPSTLDTGSTTVGLNGGIIASDSNGSIHPIIKGKINLNGLLPFNVTDTSDPGLEIQATIEGVGFDKTGSGLLLLDGNNTFTGNLQIDAGTVVPTNAAALSPSSAGVVLNGGSLELESLAIGAEPLYANSTNGAIIAYNSCSWAGPVTVNGTLNVLPSDFTDSGLIMNFSGAISGSGGVSLEDNPFVPGNVEFSGSAANTFSGPLFVQCLELQLNKPYGVQAFAGPLTVGSGPSTNCEVLWLNGYQYSGAALTLYTNGEVNLNNNNDNFGAVTFNGGTVTTGTGQFAIYQPLTVNAAGATATISGNLGLPPGQNAVFNVSQGYTPAGIDLQVNAQMFGNAPYFVKEGAGTMSLAGANTFAGATLLQSGILAMDNGTALSTTPVIISGGATLKLDANATLNQGFELSGDGTSGFNGAIDESSNIVVTLNGSMLLDAETTFNVGQVSALVMAGVISGTGPLTEIGPGEIELAGSSANAYSGGTFADQGTLVLDKGNSATAAPGNLTIGTTTATHPFGTTATVDCTQSAAIGGTNVTVNGGSLYELAGNNQTLANVNLNSGGSISTASGTLTLTGTSTAVVSVIPARGGTSVISGNLKLVNGGNFTVLPPTQFTPGAGPDLDLQAILSDNIPLGISKSSGGEMRLSAANTFFSPVTVNGGKLTLNNSAALGNSSSTTVNSNSTLAVEGGITIPVNSLTLNSSALPAWQSLNGSNFWTGAVMLSQTAAIDVEPTNGLLQIYGQGQVSGPGGLTAIGPGTLDFEGNIANTYAGVTTVSNGVVEGGRSTIVVTTNPANGRKKTNEVAVITIPGDVIIGSDATSNTAAVLRSLRESQIASAANVTIHLSGLLDLPSASGQVDPPSETFQTLTGFGLVNLGLASGLGINNTVSFTFSGNINGSGSFEKLGSATMTTSGNVNTTGSVQLLSGGWNLFGARHNGGISVSFTGDFSGDSPVRLGGDGFVDGAVTAGASITPNAVIGVDSHFPDHQGSTLHLGSLINTAGVTVQLDLFGPSPTGGNDQIVTTSGGVTLSSDTTLTANFNYPPRAGDVIDLISVPGGQSITGNFANYSDGIVTLAGTTPVLPSYEGGSGHDFTLTVTNLALGYVGYQLAEGNGNQTVEPNECNLLYVSLANRRSNALTITNAYLRAMNSNGVIVTIPVAAYPAIPAGQTMANTTPFQFSTDTNLACGGAVEFELVVGVVGEGQFAIDFSPVSGTDCSHPTGPCDSCTVASGQFTANTPTTAQPLYFVGAPSLCYPPKTYPGTNPAPLISATPYLTHNFTNSTTNLVCVTAQLEFNCSAAPTNALGVAAYLGTFDPNNPSVGYLGDIGQSGPLYPPFAFQVPAGTNFTLVVMAQATNLPCNNYTLQLFGLPCPPPVLAIQPEPATTNHVRVNWSTAYPGFTAQQSSQLNGGAFTNLTRSPVILNSRYSLTNLPVTITNQFYRLKK